MPVRARLARVPFSYIVATRDGPHPLYPKSWPLTRFPAGTILPYLGNDIPDGWRVAKIKPPKFYAEKVGDGYRFSKEDYAKMHDTMRDMRLFCLNENLFVSQKDYI
jgi:hypothetical protein